MKREDDMKCLSVQQPLAGLLVTGGKNTIYRTWSTDFRGPLLIYAGEQFTKSKTEHLVTAAIVGCVRLVDCNWRDIVGQYAWSVDSPEEFVTPVALDADTVESFVTHTVLNLDGKRQPYLFDIPAHIVEATMKQQGMTETWLRSNGYDGLWCDECGCHVDDLRPCTGDLSWDTPDTECAPGILAPCDCGDHDFHIVPGKHETVEQRKTLEAEKTSKKE